MRDLNRMSIIGRLGAEPTMRTTRTGVKVTSFSVATTRRVKGKDDPKGVYSGEETQWHRIYAWGKLAERCIEYLRKGSLVHVEGMLRTRQYEIESSNPPQGWPAGVAFREKRLSVEVHADVVRFLAGRFKVSETSAATVSVAEEPEISSEISADSQEEMSEAA